MSKLIAFDQEARRPAKGVDSLADAVKVTLGLVVAMSFSIRRSVVLVTNDGVTIARILTLRIHSKTLARS